MERYEPVELMIVTFETADVIVTSGDIDLPDF